MPTPPTRNCVPLLLLLASGVAAGQESLVCETPTDRSLSNSFLPGNDSQYDDDVISFEAGEVEASIGDNPGASMSGGIVVRRGTRVAGADAATY
ncbi:MAG: hypothetical protein RLN69_05245, partial [Woeseiaceae bacterium]